MVRLSSNENVLHIVLYIEINTENGILLILFTIPSTEDVISLLVISAINPNVHCTNTSKRTVCCHGKHWIDQSQASKGILLVIAGQISVANTSSLPQS